MNDKLVEFYSEAAEKLAEIAEKHGMFVPEGHACIDENGLHWRLSVFSDEPAVIWARLWSQNAKALGFGTEIEPGDVVLDQEGRSWTLLGLDPGGMNFPVRLLGASGKHSMASVEAATLFQLLVKKEVTAE